MKYFFLALQTLSYLYCECSKPTHYNATEGTTLIAAILKHIDNNDRVNRPAHEPLTPERQHHDNFKCIWGIRTLTVPISVDLKDVLQMNWQNHSNINDIQATLYHD